MANLCHDLEGVDTAAFYAAVDGEIIARGELFLDGIERYRAHEYSRILDDPHALWQEGTSRLLDYAPANGHPVFIVPSLVNRSYILDLKEDNSLMRYLANAGLRPLLLDWGSPGELERSFDLSDYIAGRLEQAFEAAIEAAGSPVSIMGYCMGGLMALALAERRKRDLARLVLLTTPWDFHAGPKHLIDLFKSLSSLPEMFLPLGEIPTDVLQTMFFLADPLLAVRKFSRFATLHPQCADFNDFIATEDWANDGIPLALPTARDCLKAWYVENRPMRGTWRVAGRAVDPTRIDRPALVVISQTDRLVPAESAEPLSRLLPEAELLKVSLGHVRLITAVRARHLVWPRIVAHLLP